MSDTRAVFEHHVDAFGEQDLEETMVDYTDESVVVTNDGTFRGREEIEELFTGLFAEFSLPGTTLTVDEMTVEGDFGYLLWHAETPDNVYEFCTDTFHIPDRTIEFQTYAGKTEPKD
ncbi:nuclear transport factor 2 family protein [Halosegnis sp.]|uniref:nuclear transport factor 2 family protein n=1 Tax=Halosegnis sp. TaxID=2864959 RepID=UPI0035D44400